MIGPVVTTHGRELTALCAGLAVRTLGLCLGSAALLVTLLALGPS